jgi:hypothetical protein
MTYQYSELPPERLTKFFPCTALMHWSGYDTKVIDTNIDGRDVVIQLWKGSFLAFMPGIGIGGFGAEIGLYYRNWIPGVWWPDYNHKKTISFSLVNPITKEEFFSAGPENVWWRHKWMTAPSYAEYKKVHKVPDSPTQYIMKYVINGKEYVW